MKSFLSSLTLCFLPLILGAEEHDLIRFMNGDIMHGTFKGIQEGVLWEREDVTEPIRFQEKNVSQVIFSGGQPENPIPPGPTAHLINGDEIPGKIISLDEQHLIFDSYFAGELSIPRDQLKRLQPNPHGGNLHYAGPFNSDGWLTLLPTVTRKDEKIPKAKEKKPSWVYSGAAFYNKNSAPLVRKAELPPRGRIRFKIAWKNRLDFSIAFHTDLERPIPLESPDLDLDEDEAPVLKKEKLSDLIKGDAFQDITWTESNNSNNATTFGTGYVLSIYSSHPNLNRCHFNQHGQPRVKNLRSHRSNSNLSESGHAEFDLRFDRENNFILLFINGEYISQWHDPDGYGGHGQYFGFSANNNCRVRLSDVRLTDWNGMRDTALSMKHHDRDMVLLTNGTDRFSGQVTQITNGEVTLQGPYAEIRIPLSEVEDIHYRQSQLADTESIQWAQHEALLYFRPLGRISLSNLISTGDMISADSPVFQQDLKIKLHGAHLLELNKNPHDLSEWFDEF